MRITSQPPQHAYHSSKDPQYQLSIYTTFSWTASVVVAELPSYDLKLLDRTGRQIRRSRLSRCNDPANECDKTFTWNRHTTINVDLEESSVPELAIVRQ